MFRFTRSPIGSLRTQDAEGGAWECIAPAGSDPTGWVTVNTDADEGAGLIVPAVSGDRLQVDVLGPLRARDSHGRDVTPEGVLQRRLLALLVLRRGQVVSPDVAIDVVWPDKRPRDPVAALHNHLFRLRRGLSHDVIVSVGDGYRVDPSRIDLDADRLAAAVTGGQPVDPAVVATIDEALERWHGPAYPELDDFDDGRVEAVRLAELRMRAVEVRAECRLAAGLVDDVVVALAALAAEEPLRERPRALLMTALTRSGRTVEALRVYDDFRRLLSDELGIDPSPALAAQHAGLLGGDGEASWAAADRLPVPVTSLVGREALLGDVLATVDANRLVTLIGPGGVGKTRMLVEAGVRLRSASPDRAVVLCELAAASEDSAVDAVAAALAIDGRPGVGLIDRVAAVLADDEVVLLLDNCEHVLEPIAGLVEALLARCRYVSVLATSRERLRVGGERLCAVPTLATTADDAPAVELFVDRARAVAPGFDPEAAELSIVSEIVRRLDGLPLAIELAAARLHTLDVAEVAAGLDRRFELLSAGSRTSSRHGSLNAAVSWSYGLLDEAMRRTFTDLSVFAGTFAAADAAAVCDVGRTVVPAALDQWVERSLVMRAPDRRYVMLETLRAFGAEQRATDGRADVARGRHARHYVQWVEASGRLGLESGRHGTIPEIENALPELRIALDWLLDNEHVGLAARLVTSLFDYGVLRLRPDVLAWSERVIDADPDDLDPLAADLWAVSGYYAWMAGDLSECGVRAGRAVRLSEAARGDVSPVVAMINGNFALFEGRLDDAANWYRRASDAAVGDPPRRLFSDSTGLLPLAYAGGRAAVGPAAALLAGLGAASTPHAAFAWFCAGEAVLTVDVELARERFTRAIELAEPTSASFVTGVAGASKASIDARVGDPVAAADDYRRLIAHWRRAGMWSTQWTMLRSIAALLARLERPLDAAELLGAIRATQAGHRIFGDDEIALNRLDAELRTTLGEAVHGAALSRGAALDGDAAAELALRAL